MKKTLTGLLMICLPLIFISAKAPVIDEVDAREVCLKCTGDPQGSFTCVKIKCPKEEK